MGTGRLLFFERFRERHQRCHLSTEHPKKVVWLGSMKGWLFVTWIWPWWMTITYGRLSAQALNVWLSSELHFQLICKGCSLQSMGKQQLFSRCNPARATRWWTSKGLELRHSAFDTTAPSSKSGDQTVSEFNKGWSQLCPLLNLHVNFSGFEPLNIEAERRLNKLPYMYCTWKAMKLKRGAQPSCICHTALRMRFEVTCYRNMTAGATNHDDDKAWPSCQRLCEQAAVRHRKGA